MGLGRKRLSPSPFAAMAQILAIADGTATGRCGGSEMAEMAHV